MEHVWRLWYRLFPPRPPKGKGTRENPLTIEDLQPVLRALRRIGG